ncbi:MAG: PAS domain S-box protein [Oligoflexia bacterium]|nr:PAS domain S-box protein [Oligoflexia bacterium]
MSYRKKTNKIPIGETKSFEETIESESRHIFNEDTQYRLFFENSDDAMMTFTLPNFYFTSINKAAIKLFELKNEDELLKYNLESVYTDKQFDSGDSIIINTKEMIQIALQNGINFFECIHKKSNGKSLFTTVLLTSINIDGKITLHATVRDITSQKKTELKLLETNACLDAITKSAQDAIITMDSEGKIFFWNPAAEKILGYTFQEVVGKDLHLILALKNFPSAYQSSFQTPLQNFIVNGRGKNIGKTSLLLACTKDKREIPIELSLSFMQFQNQGYVVGILRDISERVRLEVERKRATVQFIHATKIASIGTLAARVTHEILNPITVILCATEILKKKFSISDDNDFELIDDVSNSAQKITTIMKELKFYFRVDKDVVESVDVHKCIEETLKLFKYLCRSDHIVFETYLNARDYFIEANFGKIQQVIINIITNSKDAIAAASSINNKHNKCDNVDGMVVIITKNTYKNLIIEISDNGEGIPEEIITDIFEPFFTTKDLDKGTGLGLSICNNIISSYGGVIDVESKVGVGTTFKITLPKISYFPICS